MAQSTLFDLARDALRTGKLPARRPDWVWGGPSRGHECSVCGRPVPPGETSLEAEFVDPASSEGARIVHSLHVRCFAVWEQERDSSEGAPGPLLREDGTGGRILGRELDGPDREDSA
jgi:hypothetical protein